MKQNILIENLRNSSRQILREWGILEYEKNYMGLSASQAHALIEIDARNAMTAISLAEFLWLDKSSVSRLIKNLAQRGLVEIHDNPEDNRSKLIKCSLQGSLILKQLHSKATNQVQQALNNLSTEDCQTIEKGFALYAKALKKVRQISEYELRLIKPIDNIPLATLIKSILVEFDAARDGFAFTDQSLNSMFEYYQQQRSNYFVLEKSRKIYGGIGIAKLSGGTDDICEIQKMYLIKEARNIGLGQKLLETALEKAKSLNYNYCYLETIQAMGRANELYQKFGFKQLANPMGNTGHFSCNAWYLKELL